LARRSPREWNEGGMTRNPRRPEQEKEISL
jgi:hypothetical protein